MIPPNFLASAVAVIYNGLPVTTWSATMATVDIGTHAGWRVTIAITITTALPQAVSISIRKSAPPNNHSVLFTAKSTVASPVDAVTFIVASTHPTLVNHNYVPLNQNTHPTSYSISWPLKLAPDMAIHAAAATHCLKVRSIRTILIGRCEIIFANAQHPNMCVSFHSTGMRTFCKNKIAAQANYPDTVRLDLLHGTTMRWSKTTTYEAILGLVYCVVKTSFQQSQN
jgi:hypothetical protein